MLDCGKYTFEESKSLGVVRIDAEDLKRYRTQISTFAPGSMKQNQQDQQSHNLYKDLSIRGKKKVDLLESLEELKQSKEENHNAGRPQMYRNLDESDSHIGDANAKTLLEICSVDVYNIKRNKLELLTSGKMVILKFGNEKPNLIIGVNDFRYAISDDIPIAKRGNLTQYILPHTTGFYGLVLKSAQTKEHVDAFEFILFENSEYFKFNCEHKDFESETTEKDLLSTAKIELEKMDPGDDSIPITNDLIEKSSGRVIFESKNIVGKENLDTNNVHKKEEIGNTENSPNPNKDWTNVASKLKLVTDPFSTILINGANKIAEKLKEGANYTKKLIKPTKSPQKVGIAMKTTISMGKKASGSVLTFTKEKVETFTSFTESVGAKMSQNLSKLYKSGNPEIGEKQHPIDSLRVLASETAGTLSDLIDSFEEAVFIIGRGVANASVSIYEHRYGKEAAEALEGKLHIAKNVGEIARQYEKYTVRALALNTVKSLGKGIIAKKEAILSRI